MIVPDSNFEELSVYKNRERLSNLFEIEEITNYQNIVYNEKISYKKIYKIGNMLFGAFVLNNSGDAIFHYDEVLITFPFKSKTEYRSASFGGKEFTFIVFENKNTINYLTPNGIPVGGTICNFYFFI